MLNLNCVLRKHFIRETSIISRSRPDGLERIHVLNPIKGMPKVPMLVNLAIFSTVPAVTSPNHASCDPGCQGLLLYKHLIRQHSV